MSSVDDGEVYDDGTAIKNISVSGVAKKAAMFEPKQGKTTPPVLRKFRGQQHINATGGDSTTKSNHPEEKTTPSWVKKPIANGTVPPKPEAIPKSPVSPVSPKPQPFVPKKTVTHKWSPENNASTKETPVSNTFRKLSNDSNKPTSPVLKDINHNVKTQPLNQNSNITTCNKRTSVTDMCKSFQSDSSSSSSDNRITSVKPLKENTSPAKEEQSDEVVVRRPSNVSTVSEEFGKSSFSDRIASLEKSSGVKNIAQNRKSVITRKRDSKSFKRVIVARNDKNFDGSPPTKPPKLTNVDLEPIKAEYNQLMSKQDQGGEDEDLYDDIGNLMSQFSVIPSMTEEEEYADVGNVMNASDMETYDDCFTALQEPGEIYEPIDEEQTVSGGSTSSKSKESEKERKKREEKEKKEQEKKAKEEMKRKEREEKELKRKEKEEKSKFSKLKINGNEPKQGDGTIREDYNGTKLDLTVKKGDRVGIIRMENNPKGKWLIKTTDGRWGYVESENVEVATPTIRQRMIDEQEYMVADEIDANGTAEDDDVYEEL